ncbi:MAG: META domain-containing protein [Steroidobacteraceae bacterium]|jgi:uncharacterized lipoprotein YbaY/heat shock protein HslJ|nr:META domain-containing protein [Steroidobacteraceae bacterium]
MSSLPHTSRPVATRRFRLRAVPLAVLLLAGAAAVLLLVPAASAAGAGAGAGGPPAPAVGLVGGTATYRERVGLSPQAVFEAVLEDVSRADAPAIVLGRTRIDSPGQVPIRFAIAYDPAQVQGRGMYIVRATIREGERLAFTTDRLYRPFADGKAQFLQVVMRAVAARPAASAAPSGAPPPAAQAADPGGAPRAAAPPAAASALGTLPAQFRGVLPCADCRGIEQTLDLLPEGAFRWRSTYLGKPSPATPDEVGRWLFASDGRTLLLFGGREAPVRFALRDDGALRLLDLEGRPIRSSLNYDLRRVPGVFSPFEPRVRLLGAYTYLADAAAFIDCATGERLPVAQEAGARELERAYLAERQSPGAPRLAQVEGRIAQRMPMEGALPRAALVVDRFLRLAPAGESCPPPPANAPLEGTRWRLTQLDGEPAAKASGRTREAFLQFEPGQARVAGSGGCNNLTGAVARDAGQVRFTGLAGTMMACSEAAMAQEKAFTAMLERARRWLVAGRLLEFEDEAGELLARFEASDTATTPQPR